jgi:hypothetical protein
MIKKMFVVLSSLFLAVLAAHGESGKKLHFPETGFSIAPLEAPPGRAPLQALAMFLPRTGEVSPNVNVQIQPYTGSIDDYLALSMGQFQTAGFTVLQQKRIGKSALLIEYTGEARSLHLHWYAKAEKSGKYIYLATATASDEEWSKVSSKLEACVDSFRCDHD